MTTKNVLFLFSRSHCAPKNGKCDAMFLTPLKKPTDTQWYADSPLGKNTGSTVKNIMKMVEKIEITQTTVASERQ